MNGWRPDNWKTLKAAHHPMHCLAPDDCVSQSYEAGADAMLEAVNKNRVTLPDIIYFLTKGKREGHLVLIPDQKPPDGCNSEET